ncbi:acyl-CoA dehydrogenase [Thermosyntropha lipolytica DSM 11003]|uniref:Acyl-CoA dehydrogenase n=1 Tax=Thermosyntropha lipolytica DSM 11003 TaxID=1123382 RepID=A0A1M5N7Z8_9FIRM|nr:acyl-CoA dehydrogenase family protein [Thermosyntropha lipolytica]SHG85611.1 acyl-CoA dehydrogenase [Thermosyntropha lipolytica DSM 11003]
MFRSTISPGDRELVMMVRELVDKEIKPRAVNYDTDEAENFDWTPLNLLAKHNLVAPNIPPEYGGRGLGNITTAMILEEIAVGSAGLAAVLLTNLHAVSPLLTVGSEEQKKEILPQMTAPSPKLAAATIIEHRPNLELVAQPEAMDVRHSSVNVEDIKEGDLIVKGIKDYVMNAGIASFIAVALSTNPAQKGSGLQIAILPMDTEGITVGAPRKILGLRYCRAYEVIFDNVRVKEKYLIGKKGSGFLVFMQNLDRVTPLAAALSLGVARAAYEAALEASRQRMFMGRPLFEESAVSFALVDMATKINAARQSVHLACWLMDQDLDYSQASSKAKIIASNVAQEVTARAMEIIGGQAYLYGHRAEIYMRDAKMLSIVDGSEQFHRNLLAVQLY